VAPSKPEITENDQAKAAVNDKTVSSDPLPSQSSSPRPELPVAASQEAKADVSESSRDQRDQAQGAKPQAATWQKAKQEAEAQPAEARQGDLASAKHEQAKQSVQPVPPGNAQPVISIAPVAKTAKWPHVRQASRGFEKRPLEVMTLRTIELPDGRRLTRLIPHRGGDRYRDAGPPMAFGPDE
jgi:hypothetical protein